MFLLLLFAASAGFFLFHSPDFRLSPRPHGRESVKRTQCINTALTVNLPDIRAIYTRKNKTRLT